MFNINVTKLSSRGQIVVPLEMRKNLHEGDKFVIIQKDNQFILKKVEDFESSIEEDIEFAKRTDEAIERYERGEGEWIKMSGEEFLKELEKW